MNIKELGEEVRKYDRYLLGLELKAKELPPPGRPLRPSQHFLKHLIEVSGKVSMIMSGIEHSLKAAREKKDEKKVEELRKLFNQTKTMFEKYGALKKSVEETMRQRATA